MIDDRSSGTKMGFSDVEISFEVAERPVECVGCGIYGEAQEFGQCEQCREYFCSECNDLRNWRGLLVCPWCQADLIRDKGEDLEDTIARAEYLEDR